MHGICHALLDGADAAESQRRSKALAGDKKTRRELHDRRLAA